MNAGREIKLQVRVSSPKGPSKQPKPKSPKKAARPTTQTFSSTLLTSPLAPQVRRPANRSRPTEDNMETYGFSRDDFVASDYDEEYDEEEEEEEEAFAPLPKSRTKRTDDNDIGPPISADQYFRALPDVHRICITQFVDDAKRQVEKWRNSKNLKKPIFTEMNLRDMAAYWSTTMESLGNITGINPETVERWGPKILPVIKLHADRYNEAMNENDGRDMDPNHKVVIDLSSDVEEDLDEDDADIRAAEESPYFEMKPPTKQGGRNVPWRRKSRSNSVGHKKSAKGFAKGKGRSNLKGSGRESAGSMSGISNTGISKRRSSGFNNRSAATKTGSSNTYKQPSLMSKFGNKGGNSGGGIGMMPT